MHTALNECIVYFNDAFCYVFALDYDVQPYNQTHQILSLFPWLYNGKLQVG